MNVETLLKDRIKHNFEQLNEMEVDSESYKATVDELVKLLDRDIELKKIDVDIQEKSKNRDNETDLKLKEMEEEKKDRLIKNAITAAGIAIPTLVTIWGTIKSIEFEKEGTITTIMGRGFINKLLPKK